MRILIAEDDEVSRCVLEATLLKWGYEVLTVADGVEALRRLESENPPELAILDWMMPGLDGLEVCRSLRQSVRSLPSYIILLTAREGRDNLVQGLEAGADDYLTKPFDRDELRARLKVGLRIVLLQRHLAERVRQLEEALGRVKQLQGLLPICSYCKKIRKDQGYWEQVESYISDHSEAQFSHGICPECYDKFVTPQFQERDNPAERMA